MPDWEGKSELRCITALGRQLEKSVLCSELNLFATEQELTAAPGVCQAGMSSARGRIPGMGQAVL